MTLQMDVRMEGITISPLSLKSIVIKIYRVHVVSLFAHFQQVRLVQNFKNVHNIVKEHQ